VGALEAVVPGGTPAFDPLRLKRLVAVRALDIERIVV
jgi:hypothetical protein